MSTADADVNPYELLGVTLESTEPEIRKAYRQRSLKVHPDRNPNNKDAARLFHELNQAYELLLDPLRRLALDATLRVKEARKARFATYDNKRKNLQEELEAREREFKKRKTDQAKEARDRFQEAEQIKEEGRKLREQKEKELHRREELDIAARAPHEETAPALGALDTTIKLKYQLTAHPSLTTAPAIDALLKQFGQTDASSIVLSLKPPKKDPHKPPKFATVLVPFKQIGDAFAVVCASGRADRGLDSIDVTWAEGQEPAIIGWLKAQGMLGGKTESSSRSASGASQSSSSRVFTAASNAQEGAHGHPFSSFPDSFPSADPPPPKQDKTIPAAAGLDYEALTLMRLRQAERQRLEQEIREQESDS